MSVDSITLSFEGHTDAVITTQDWTSDPDRVEIIIDRKFIEKSKRIADFLNKEDVSYAVEYYALGYGIFQDNDLNEEEEYDGELKYDGVNARIRKDGTIRAEFPSKFTSDTLYIELGSIAELESKMDAEQDDNQSPAM